jgi:hypothetical protein
MLKNQPWIQPPAAIHVPLGIDAAEPAGRFSLGLFADASTFSAFDLQMRVVTTGELCCTGPPIETCLVGPPRVPCFLGPPTALCAEAGLEKALPTRQSRMTDIAARLFMGASFQANWRGYHDRVICIPDVDLLSSQSYSD